MQLQKNIVLIVVYINNKIQKLVWHFSAKFLAKKRTIYCRFIA